MSLSAREELRTLFRTTRSLTPTQRLVVLTYAAMDRHQSGAVVKSGTELADEAGLNMKLFSRVRREVVDLGFLEEVPALRKGKVCAYRLTAKAMNQEAGASPSVAA